MSTPVTQRQARSQQQILSGKPGRKTGSGGTTCHRNHIASAQRQENCSGHSPAIVREN